MKDNKDREEVLAAVKQDGYALDDADESLRKDTEIVMAAVKQVGNALDYADESLKKDKEIVMAAVKQEGSFLKFASEELQNDPELKEITFYEGHLPDWYEDAEVEDKVEWADEWEPENDGVDINWLAGDVERDVREALALNKNIPIPILEKLAKDEVWLVRSAVSRNPNTPKAILDALELELDQ